MAETKMGNLENSEIRDSFRIFMDLNRDGRISNKTLLEQIGISAEEEKKQINKEKDL